MWYPGSEGHVEDVEHSDTEEDILLPNLSLKKLLKVYGTSNDGVVRAQAYRIRSKKRGLLRRLRLYPVHLDPDFDSESICFIKDGDVVLGKDLGFKRFKVQSKEKTGWVLYSSSRDGPINLVPCNLFRRYKVWPGRNIFCCNGHVMVGPGVDFLCLTNILVLVMHASFGLLFCHIGQHISSCWMSLTLELYQDLVLEVVMLTWLSHHPKKRNYRSFLILTMNLCFTTTFMLVILFHPWMSIFWCLIFVTLSSLFKLFWYHIYLMYMGQTTYEMVRNVYLEKRNKYNKGFMVNFLNIAWGPVKPSRLPNMTEHIEGRGVDVDGMWDNGPCGKYIVSR